MDSAAPLPQQAEQRLRLDIRHFLQGRCQQRDCAAARDQPRQVRARARLEDRDDFGFHGNHPPPMSPAVTLIANPRIDALNRNEISSCAITTLRIDSRVVDTSAVWHAAAIVNEK